MRLPLLLTFAVLFLATSLAPVAHAQTDLDLSPDITIDLDGTFVADEAVAFDPNPGTTSLTNLGPLPESADVIAFHRQSPIESLFALDTTVSLGGNVYAPGDVISWNGSTHSLAFDAVAAGLPQGLEADAVGRDSLGNILLSFDHTADLGGGVIASDEDVVRFIGVSPSIAFDGSATGLADGLDVDGLHALGVGRFVLSFDTGGMIGGVAFADEDLLYVDSTAGTWYLLVDGSELDADLAAADVDAFAVPEPGLGGSLVCGGAFIGWLGGRRRRSIGRFRRAERSASVSGASGVFGFGLLVVMLSAFAAHAGDGVLEINQTCAIETGCFAGDTPGFPVTISAPGSYRLTSNLAIATDVNGIFISSSYVTLDLGGFEIAGPGTCTGTGATLSCGGVGSGVGIVGLDVLYGVTVRNGVVRNMRLDGVGVGGAGSLGVRIEGITARHNARLGISGQDGVLARNCVAIENGGNGFDLDAGSVVQDSTAIGNFGHGVEIDDAGGVVSGTTSRSNAGRGFNVVAGSKFGKNNLSTANGSPDSCGGLFCSERKRHFTAGDFPAGGGGDDIATICGPGFRVISQNELMGGKLAQYEGLSVPESITISSSSVSHFELSDGGGFGDGTFACVDANDINGSQSGIRCSRGNVQALTSGWHGDFSLNAPVLPTICIEE